MVKMGSSSSKQEMRNRIMKAVGSGCKVLFKSIPSLQTFMEEYDEVIDHAFGPAATEQRWKYLLCKLVSASSSKAHPLVIFLDDLQWADETSLDVIRMMVTDPDIKYILFVMVHRDIEESSTRRLKRLFYGMQEQGITLMSIKIGPIEKDCVNTLLSETLCLPPRLCLPLSTTIYNKTGGIVSLRVYPVSQQILHLTREPHFSCIYTGFICSAFPEVSQRRRSSVVQFKFSKMVSVSLRRSGFHISITVYLSHLSHSSVREFDTRAIELKEISQDVVVHMSERMTRLPHGIQSGLKLAACLGSKFDAHLLEKGVQDPDVDIKEFLRFAVEGGYLRGNVSTGKYAWAHDQVQQAAYELIPESKRESFHLLLGSRMVSNCCIFVKGSNISD